MADNGKGGQQWRQTTTVADNDGTQVWAVHYNREGQERAANNNGIRHTCPKPLTGVEEHYLEEVYKGRSRLSKSDSKLIIDLIWFKVKKQLKREGVCIA